MEVTLRKIKNWVLSWDFVRQEMYSRVFKQAQDDFKETFAEDIEKRASELAEKKLEAILTPVSIRSIVTVDKTNRFILIGGKRVEEGRLKNLKNEAEFIVRSDIWKLIHETPKSLAERQMFVSSESLDDMKKGKSILYTLDTQKNIVDLLASYTQNSSLPAKKGV